MAAGIFIVRWLLRVWMIIRKKTTREPPNRFWHSFATRSECEVRTRCLRGERYDIHWESARSVTPLKLNCTMVAHAPQTGLSLNGPWCRSTAGQLMGVQATGESFWSDVSSGSRRCR